MFKTLNRLAILGLLACGSVWGQDVFVKVGLSTPGPAFLVDGEIYTSTQLLRWTVGSTHQVYFVQSPEADGTVGNHQYPTYPGIRYTFVGWSVNGQVQPSSARILVTVDSNLTAVLGDVSLEYLLSINFSGFTDPTLPCSPTPIANDPRQGVISVSGTCFSAPGTMWVSPGNIFLEATSYPGFVFTSWSIGGGSGSTQPVMTFRVGVPLDIMAVFTKSKRARFRSNPLGLSLYVDHQLIQPGFAPLPTASYSTDPYCPVSASQQATNFPVGYTPLCIGDFDFLPGSQHVVSATASQTDADGKTWIFTGFSGPVKDGIYTADGNTGATDFVFANFAPGARIRVITSPANLKVNIDGKDDATGPVFVWGEGETHHFIAPATQTDATGRPWKFVSWSNGGSADQTFTVPAGVAGLQNVTATYAPAGKLQVISDPSGLPFTVDGAACNTPCIILDKPTGAKVQVVAPATVTPDAFRRYTFGSWNGGSTSNSLQVTIGDQGQVFTATYKVFNKLTATSQPANQVNFQISPSSSDGFYLAGTQVSVKASPKNGFTFKRWTGDLGGTDPAGTLFMNSPHSVVAVLNGFPYISEGGVRNAAGITPSGTVGPGSDISIVGSDLSATTTSAPAGELDQAIDDVWVTVNDRLLPLLYISPELINAQLFSDLPDGDYTLTVHRTAQFDASRIFTVRRNSPGIFQWFPAQGDPTIAALHEDGSVLNPDSPAKLNETISVYGTGFGLYDRPLVDGFPTPDTGDWNLIDSVTVAVDGQTYTPITARAANGYAGMVVLRIKLTGSLPSGLIDFKVTVNNVNSNTVKLPVK